MARESSRDTLLAKSEQLKALKGVQARPSDDPFRYVADDGQKFSTYAEMVAHNLGVTARDRGNRSYEVTQNRLYRRA